MPTPSPTKNRGTERAVSPVIGVILMVAISVILAAVIGAFVLEIGDQQETAPRTSFDVEEREVTLKSDRAKNLGFNSNTVKINTTQIELTHAGGETLRVSQSEMRVEGHRDAWGVVPHASALEMGAGDIDDAVDVGPQPDYRSVAGTNQPVELTSGASWNVVAYDSIDPGSGKKKLYEPGTRDLSTPAAESGMKFLYVDQGPTSRCSNSNCAQVLIYAASSIPPSGSWGNAWSKPRTLVRGDTVNVIWTAQSGGKTQTLQKYAAQHAPIGDDAND